MSASESGRGHVPRVTQRFRQGARPVGDGVERVLKHLKAPSSEVVESVFSDWKRLVGDVIGEHTRPARIENGVLFIEVDEPAWASEMQWMSEDILRRITETASTTEITSIKVILSR